MTPSALNAYSATWFATFSESIAAAQTEREVDFIARNLPRERHPRLLDLCCGQGRHGAVLARRGYRITGVDANAAALRAARASAPAGVEFLHVDARQVARLGQRFDGVICMWQSFGHFTEEENERQLVDLGTAITPQGRFVLDVFNAEFFRTRQGTRELERTGRRITERKSIAGGRLRVELTYDHSDRGDIFDWRIYDPAELRSLLESAGWSVIVGCRSFDEMLAPAADEPRMQFVAALARPGSRDQPRL